jgi:hypothetical protein
MNRRQFALVAAAVVLLVTQSPPCRLVAQPQFPANAIIRGENVRVRAEPTENAINTAILQRGDAVILTGQVETHPDGAFYPVEVPGSGVSGWVLVLFISPDRIEPVSSGSDGQTPVVDTPNGRASDTGNQRRLRRAARERSNEATVEALTEPVPEPASAVTIVPEPAPASASTASPVPEEPPVSGDALDNPAPANTLLQHDPLGIVVLGGRFLWRVGSATVEEGFAFLELSVSVQNDGTEPYHFTPAAFRAQDVTTGAAFEPIAERPDGGLAETQVPASESIMGKLYFVVPKGTKQALVTFDPNPSATGDELYWQIP